MEQSKSYVAGAFYGAILFALLAIGGQMLYGARDAEKARRECFSRWEGEEVMLLRDAKGEWYCQRKDHFR